MFSSLQSPKPWGLSTCTHGYTVSQWERNEDGPPKGRSDHLAACYCWVQGVSNTRFNDQLTIRGQAVAAGSSLLKSN